MYRLLATASLAAMLALDVGGASQALADIIKHTQSPTGDHVYTIYNDEGKKKGIVVYDENYKFLYSFRYGSTPGDDGGSSSSTLGTQGIKDALEQAMQNGGGSYRAQRDFFETPLGKSLVETGKTGSIVPYHNPADVLATDFEGGYGGKGGIDLNGGSIADQIKQHGPKKKKKKDDGDDGDLSPGRGQYDQFGGASGDPELVNPVPIDRSTAKRSKKKVQHVSPQMLAPKQDQKRGLRTVLTDGGILASGPGLLPAGPAPTGASPATGIGSRSR